MINNKERRFKITERLPCKQPKNPSCHRIATAVALISHLRRYTYSCLELPTGVWNNQRLQEVWTNLNMWGESGVNTNNRHCVVSNQKQKHGWILSRDKNDFKTKFSIAKDILTRIEFKLEGFWKNTVLVNKNMCKTKILANDTHLYLGSSVW